MPLTFTPEERKEMLETSFFYEEIEEEKARKTARKMLLDSLPVETVAKYTGLPLEEIERIQQGLKG